MSCAHHVALSHRPHSGARHSSTNGPHDAILLRMVECLFGRSTELRRVPSILRNCPYTSIMIADDESPEQVTRHHRSLRALLVAPRVMITMSDHDGMSPISPSLVWRSHATTQTHGRPHHMDYPHATPPTIDSTDHARGVWWLDCHADAGGAQLAATTRLGIAGGACWPTASMPRVDIVMVCRATARGTAAATRSLDRWLTRGRPVPVRSLVAIAPTWAATAAIVQPRLDLIAEWVPVWRVTSTATAATATHPALSEIRRLLQHGAAEAINPAADMLSPTPRHAHLSPLS